MPQAILSFEVWIGYLRKDCERREKLRELDGLGEYVLRLLWERGLDPTVQAIVDDGQPKDRLAEGSNDQETAERGLTAS
jgi:hypothetical protein